MDVCDARGGPRASGHAASAPRGGAFDVRREFATLSIDDLFGKLRVLSVVRPGEKLSFGPLRIDPPGLSTSFLRWWNSEGRQHTIDGLNALYDHAFLRVHEERDVEYAKQLVELIAASTQVITALETTYCDDQTMVGTLQGIRDCTILKLATAQKALGLIKRGG